MTRTSCLQSGSIAFALCIAAAAATAACNHNTPTDWGAFDLLKGPRPPAQRSFDGATISEDSYKQFVRYGEAWFRGATFGNERTTTDVVGLMQASLDVPCAAPSAGSTAPALRGGAIPGCYRKESALKYFVRAIDKLDGVQGNLFSGNGGPNGNGYTSNLVIEFPVGTRLLGIEVPQRVETGLDVEAGSPFPIGIVPVPAPAADASLPYLIDPATLDAGPVAQPGKLRVGITCALCHYSLDVDWDGKADLRSAWIDQPTAGSPYRPQDSWAIGNQDLHVGWLFALAGNPLLGFAVLSGPIGVHDLKQSARWVNWVRDNYERAPTAVAKEVVRGMITQPRGYADISPNALYDNVQFPLLFTRNGWPYNLDGSLINAGDRNNSVWTTALDFTGLIGLAKDRSAAGQLPLYWESLNVYDELPAERLADMMVLESPAVRYDPTQRKRLRDDILGVSDGVPGLLRPDSVVVIDGAPPGMVPPDVMAVAKAAGLVREPGDAGQDGALRGPTVALVGVRVRTPPEVRTQIDLASIEHQYPAIHGEEFVNNAVSLMLDSLNPPASQQPLVLGSEALWQKGYEVFKEHRCVTCHRGPFLTDNLVHRISTDRRAETGLPTTPSTAGWRIPGRGRGPAINSEPDRMLNSRVLQLYAAPNYDPKTGLAVSAGSPLNGLFGDKTAGYKTAPLRYLWGSAPFLHDGGVAVALDPHAAPAGNDLKALLKRVDCDKLYGMGAVFARRESDPSAYIWPNAALSLQALLLKSERERVIAANTEPVVAAPRSDVEIDAFGHAPVERFSMASQGVRGVGHEFFIDDDKGGDEITALVAFLLALEHFPLSAQAQAPSPAP